MVLAAVDTPRGPVGRAEPAPAAPAARAGPIAPAPVAPRALERRLKALAEGLPGFVGVAVTDVQDGWTAAYNGEVLLPQQSVSKLWVALAAFDAVDRGALALSDTVRVGPADMSVFHQPIQARLEGGDIEVTVDELLVGALADSDNAADDILVRRVGGSAAVEAAVRARGLAGVRPGPEQTVLQSALAGLDWRPEYSFGQAFWAARDQVPIGVRIRALETYLADPPDGAAAAAITRALARLQRGELLSPASTRRFLDILATTRTGPMRLKAGLEPGWAIAHKTGTGQELGDLQTGYNDVGLITAPDGRAYAVAVMIAHTRRPIPERQAMMAAVARAVVDLHAGRDLAR
jgi:beta-lactamase class A